MMKNFFLILFIAFYPGVVIRAQDTTQISDQTMELFAYKSLYIPAYYKKILTRLNLPEITQSKDNFLLRMWTSSMMGFTMAVVSKADDNYEAHRFHYLLPESISEDSFFSKIPLTIFIDSLNNYDLQRLKSQAFISGFQDPVDDGVTYILEIKQGDLVNAVSFHSPESYSDATNQEFYGIVKLFDAYFNTLPPKSKKKNQTVKRR